MGKNAESYEGVKLMKTVLIVTEEENVTIKCDCVDLNDGILSVIFNHHTIAQFKKWDYWHFKDAEVKELRD